MRATVTIEKEKLDKLLRESGSRTKASAVRIAIDEYLRAKRIDKIKSMRGKLEFDLDGEEIRHRER